MSIGFKPARVTGAALGLLVACAPKPEPEPPVPPPKHHEDEHGHTHHEGMPHRFEDAEAWVDHFESPEREAWQKPDAVVAGLALPEDALVADIGAGTGYFSVRLARAVPRGKVFASDIEPDMVRYLRERAEREALANLVPVQGTADDPKIPQRVDVVFICNVYHHIEDRSAFFGRVREALQPGGRLVLVDFEKDAPADAPGPPAELRVSAEQMARELAGAGYALVTADHDLLPYQYVATFEAGK